MPRKSAQIVISDPFKEVREAAERKAQDKIRATQIMLQKFLDQRQQLNGNR